MTLWIFVFSFIFYALANAHTYSDQQIESDLTLVKKSTFQLLSQKNNGSVLPMNSAESASIINSIFDLCAVGNPNTSVKTTLGKYYSIDLISCGENSTYQIVLITNKKRTEVIDLHLFQINASLVVATENHLKFDVNSKYYFKDDGLLNSDNIIFNLNDIKHELVRDIKSKATDFFLISGFTIESTSNLIKGLFKKATHTVLEKYASDYNDRANQNFPLMHKNVSSQNLLSLDSISFSVTYVFDNHGIELAD